MDKIYRYFPATLFCLYFTQIFTKGLTPESVYVLGILAAFIVSWEYKGKDREMKALNDKLQANIEEQQKQAKEIDQLRTHVTGLKLSTTRLNQNAR